MRRLCALLVCIALATTGCASSGATTRVNAPGTATDRAALASYVKQLPVGSRVKVTLADGHTIRGTLLQATDVAIIVQRRTRVPEPPDTVAFDRVAIVDIESGSTTTRAVWIGFAAGAAGAIGVLLILAALFAGD